MNPEMTGKKRLSPNEAKEMSDRITALSDGLNGLRERLDAELRLIHRLVNEGEAKLVSLEARIKQLEGRMYVTPEMVAQIEKSVRAEQYQPPGPGINPQDAQPLRTK